MQTKTTEAKAPCPLAVMNLAAEALTEFSPSGVNSRAAKRLDEARAAVAELVEAASVVIDLPDVAFTALCTDAGAVDRLYAALARFGGAA